MRHGVCPSRGSLSCRRRRRWPRWRWQTRSEMALPPGALMACQGCGAVGAPAPQPWSPRPRAPRLRALQARRRRPPSLSGTLSRGPAWLRAAWIGTGVGMGVEQGPREPLWVTGKRLGWTGRVLEGAAMGCGPGPQPGAWGSPSEARALVCGRPWSPGLAVWVPGCPAVSWEASWGGLPGGGHCVSPGEGVGGSGASCRPADHGVGGGEEPSGGPCPRSSPAR